MMIGRFRETGKAFAGTLRTITLKLDVVIEPVAQAPGAFGPSHHIYTGTLWIGAAWENHDEAGRRFLTLRLDDPLFPAPINATLKEAEAGAWIAEWVRPGSAKFATAA